MLHNIKASLSRSIMKDTISQHDNGRIRRVSFDPLLEELEPPSTTATTKAVHFNNNNNNNNNNNDSHTSNGHDEKSPLLANNNGDGRKSTISSQYYDDGNDSNNNNNNNNKKKRHRLSYGSGRAPSPTITTTNTHHHPGSNGKGWRILKTLLAQGDLALKLKEQEQREQQQQQQQQQNGDGKKQRTRSSYRRQVFEEFHTGISFTVEQCLVVILAYITVSVLVFSFLLEPQWTIVDSSYFAVTTFTTLGYGDLTPTSNLSRLFTAAYALLGVIALGVALGNLGNQIIERHQTATSHVQQMTQKRVMSLFSTDSWRNMGVSESSSASASSLDGDSAVVDNSTTSNSMRYATESMGTTCSSTGSTSTRATIFEKQEMNVPRLIVLAVLMLIMAFWIGYNSGWNFPDTMYYLIITGSTIGYGDLTPTTQTGRCLAVFFIPFACGVMGHVLGYIANQMIENRAHEFLSKYKAKELTQDDIDAMDVNNDGKVSWSEFLEFMLIAMDKIDYELLDELQAYFQNMDVSGSGELSRDDLVEMTQRKLKSPRRKLELAAYKQRLLEQAKHEQQRRSSVIRIDWLPQLFRRHDDIRQPWRRKGSSGMNGRAGSGAAQYSMQAACEQAVQGFVMSDDDDSDTSEAAPKRLDVQHGAGHAIRDTVLEDGALEDC